MFNSQHKPFPEGAYDLDGNPDYLTRNGGMFRTSSFGPVDFEFAVRKDWRKIGDQGGREPR